MKLDGVLVSTYVLRRQPIFQLEPLKTFGTIFDMYPANVILNEPSVSV